VTLFEGASANSLRRLAEALRDGRVTVPLTAFALERHAPGLPAGVSDGVVRLAAEGMAAPHLALLLEQAAQAAEARLALARDIEFVWTGLEGANAHVRDTAVVVEQLFANAQRSVLVSTYAVQQGSRVFEALSTRMTERPGLAVRLFVHVERGERDTRHDSELLREFAVRFARQWPWPAKPEVYYDPRGLAMDKDARANWHAKCVVVDDEHAFVTSANFTEWAQQRNVEAGVLVHRTAFARDVRQQFDSLVASSQVRRVPGL
jgi:hypothetical protein